jgi:predicted RNase H-like nuclease (RuvC/YqgF family)
LSNLLYLILSFFTLATDAIHTALTEINCKISKIIIWAKGNRRFQLQNRAIAKDTRRAAEHIRYLIWRLKERRNQLKQKDEEIQKSNEIMKVMQATIWNLSDNIESEHAMTDQMLADKDRTITDLQNAVHKLLMNAHMETQDIEVLADATIKSGVTNFVLEKSAAMEIVHNARYSLIS